MEIIKNQFTAWNNYYSGFLTGNTDANIVDLGCGNGGFVYWLRSLDYKNAVGVDVSSEQIELGKKIGISGIEKDDLSNFLKTRKNFFDLIFIRDVLGHFEKAEVLEIMELIFESLKKGGTLIIKTPNAESPMSGRLRYGDFTHDTSFTGSSLKQILLAYGFDAVQVFSVRPTAHGPISFLRLILWFCIELRLRLYRLVEAGSGVGVFTQNVIVIAKKS
ncbi:MAG: class I SAM-dependent methyltransferase [Patescibacteria group bacterium]